jgi:hypothetical protein
MNKTMVSLSKVLAMLITMQFATMAAAARPVKESGHEESAISVFTYTVGGPRHAKGPRLVNDAVVRVRRRDASGRLVREVKHTMNGHVIFPVKPGVYQIEAAIEPPEATPRFSCGHQIVRVHKDRRVLVKLYCSIP